MLQRPTERPSERVSCPAQTKAVETQHSGHTRQKLDLLLNPEFGRIRIPSVSVCVCVVEMFTTVIYFLSDEDDEGEECV
jgi:hypothetical protein